MEGDRLVRTRKAALIAFLSVSLLLGIGWASARAGSGRGPSASPAGFKNPGPFCKAKRATITGTKRADLIRGTAKRDVIVSFGGDDEIHGRGGRDLICAGGGDDDVRGGGGGDELRGGNGDDTVRGNAGNDRVKGNPGDDALRGGAGRDRCNGGKGHDTTRGCEKGAGGKPDVPRLLPPEAVADNASAGEDGPATTIDVLANDSDPEGGALEIVAIHRAGTRGRVLNQGGTEVSYEPNGKFEALGPGESDTDSFSYTIRDPDGFTDTATVTVTVNGVNDAPVPGNDSFASDAGDPGGPADRNAIGNTTLDVGGPAGAGPERMLTGSLLDNDTDPDASDALAVSEVQGSGANVAADTTTDQGGTVKVAADGSFIYDPPVGFTGTDTFTYAAGDTHGGSSTATVSIEVAGMIWYVDSSAAGSADSGSSNDPFTDLRDLNGLETDIDGPGETIFLYQGDSDGTSANAYEYMPLEPNQKLIGEPAGLTVDGTALVAADPGRPDITDDPDPFGSGNGVELAGGVMVDSVATVGTFGDGFSGDGVGGFTLSDPLVRSSGGGAVDLEGLNAAAEITGTLEVNQANTQGLGVYDSTAAGALTVNRIDIEGTGFEGVALGRFGANAGAVTISGGDVSGAGGSSATVGANDQGLRVDGGSANVTFDATIGANDSNSTGVAINGRSGGTVSIGGGVTDTGGGIDIGTDTANTGGTFNFAGAIDLDTTTNAGVAISNSTGAATSFMGGLDINSSTGTGFAVSNGGTVNVCANTGCGSGSAVANTITTTAGTALDIGGATAGMSFDSVSASTSTVGDPGVELDGLSGSLTVAGGSITSTGSATAFDNGGPVADSGGSADVNYGGTITNSAGHAVLAQERSGGSLTLGGAITDTGSGILLENNDGSTITFSGGLDLDTGTSAGFMASNGGTVNVCADANCGSGAARVNTIDTTTGTGLDLNGVAIGAADMTFRSVSSNGAVNGIELDSVSNAGTVNVTGTGSAGSGGTIQNVTQSGVDIAGSSAPVVLQQMQITNPADDGVFAGDSADVTVRSSSINDWGAGDIGVEATATTGTSNVAVDGTSALRSTLDDTGAGGPAIVVQPSGSSTINASIDRTDITEASDGIVLSPADAASTLNAEIGDPGAGDLVASSSGRVTISGTTDDAVQVSGDAGSANVLLDEVDTKPAGGGDHGVEIAATDNGASAGADFDVIVEDSAIGFAPGGGRHADEALNAIAEGAVQSRIDLLLNHTGFGSAVDAVGLVANNAGTLNASMYSNNMSGGGSARYGLLGATGFSTTAPTMCLDVAHGGGDNAISSLDSGGAVLISKDPTSTFQVDGLGAGSTATDVKNLLLADNFFISGAVDVSGSGFTDTDCPQPTAP